MKICSCYQYLLVAGKTPVCRYRPAYTSHNSGGIAIVYQLTSQDSGEITYVILVIIDQLTRWEDLLMGFTTNLH